MHSKFDKTELPQPMLNLLGADFPVSELPIEVQGMLAQFIRWEKDKQSLIDELQKHDAALRSLSVEIATRVSQFRAEWKARPVDHAAEASV